MKRAAIAALGACAAAWASALLEARPPAYAPVVEPQAERTPLNTPPAVQALRLTEPQPTAAPGLPMQAAREPAQEHPHPITPEHQRLQRELQLIASLNDALDRRDAPALRALLALYRTHDPTDEQRLQAGYQCLADCLQSPGAASTAAARAYYEAERASSLRRYIRRTCLEDAL